MRILQLISSAGHYGAENMLLTLAQNLQAMRCRVRVAVFYNAHKPNIEIAHQAARLGLQAQVIACRGRMDRDAVRAICESIRTHEVDLLHTHGYKADLYGYAAARKTGVSLVATCHNWPDRNLPLWFYSVLDRLVLRRFPRVVAVSEGVKEALWRFGVPRNRVSVIANGVDLARFGAVQPSLGREISKGDRLVVGTVGRLVPAKGGVYFLRAAREVLRVFASALFVLVGDGPEREKLETLAHQLGIQSSVVFVGQRDDIPGVYASFDIVALPSLAEAMPLAVLEALAAKRPVVASQVGDVPRMILHEQTGLLVKPGDDRGLADAIMRLLADGGLRRKLGQNGHALVQQRFSAARMAGNYLGVYEEVMGEGKSRTEPLAERKIVDVLDR